jgi:N-acetylneuraminic acid mutarotase
MSSLDQTFTGEKMKTAFQLLLVSFVFISMASIVNAQIPEVTHNTWTSGAPMLTPRVGAAFGVIKGKVYVVSGATNSAVVATNEIYNIAKNTWTTGAPIPTARYVPASAVVDNVLYVIGGCNSSCATGGGALNVVEAYNPATNVWSEKSPIPTVIDSVYAVVSKKIIYVVGGYVPGTGRVPTLYSYNPASDTWKQEASMAVGKSNPATGVLGGIIAAGGLENGGNTNDTESYAIAKNTWKTLPAMPTTLNSSCFGTVSGKFYVASGSDNNGPNSAVQAYTGGTTKSWTTGLASIPQATVAPASAVAKGQLYCIGGANTGALFASKVYGNVQIYQP